MTRLIASLAEMKGYSALLCDLWGCLHDGHRPFPAAVAALQGFRARGGKVVLLTNAPRPNAAVIRQLDRMGLPRDTWDLVVSSGDAAQEGMLAGLVGRRVFHIGAEKDEPFFTEGADPAALATIARVPLSEAEGIVCTGLAQDLSETPADYAATLHAAHGLGLPMLCANPDIVVDMGEKRLWCAGALARDYEAIGGRALYFGKPHSPVYALVRRRLAEIGGDAPDDRILAVGDGIDTDIRGGLAEGIDTLYVTGGIHAADFGPDPEAPGPDRLDAWLDARQVSPTAAIARLR